MSSILTDAVNAAHDSFSNLIAPPHTATLSPLPADASFRALVANIDTVAPKLARAKLLIQARDVALTELRAVASPTPQSPPSFQNYQAGAGNTPGDDTFVIRRVARAQSYLAMTWSLYESLWAAIRPILTPKHHIKDTNKKTYLVVGWIINGKTPSIGMLGEVLSARYGWSFGVSYATRCRLMHDAYAGLGASDVFESADPSRAFVVSDAFLDWLKEECKSKWTLSMPAHNTWGHGTWPHSSDLISILIECQNDIDAAFAVLLKHSESAARQTIGMIP